MTKSTLRRARLIIQGDIINAMAASRDVLKTSPNAYRLGMAYDFEYIANEYTIIASELLKEEALRGL